MGDADLPAGWLSLLHSGPGVAGFVGHAEDAGVFFFSPPVFLLASTRQSKDWPLHRQMQCVVNAVHLKCGETLSRFLLRNSGALRGGRGGSSWGNPFSLARRGATPFLFGLAAY